MSDENEGIALIKPFSDVIEMLSQLRVLIHDLAGGASKWSYARFRKELRSHLRQIRFVEHGTLKPLVAYLENRDPGDLYDPRGHLKTSTALTRRAIKNLRSMTDRIADTDIDLEIFLNELISKSLAVKAFVSQSDHLSSDA